MGQQILIIEDDAQSLRLFTKVLENEGYIVFTATTLQEAHLKLANHHYDLVLSDIRLGNTPRTTTLARCL